jgi:hypothetical protein
MPKYLLLKHYTGGPEHHPNSVPMSEWTEDEITAHMAFQRHVGELLRERGELVDVQALSPEGTYVRYGGPDAAYVSSAPGKGGQPIYEWIEVRPVMGEAPATAE